MVLRNIAQKISDDTSRIIGYPVSISDENGYLIGVNELERLGLYDKLFAEVLKTRELTYWDEDAVIGLDNIYPGVAAPIIVNNKVLGAVGILGKTGYNPETTSYIKLVKNHIEMMCHETIRKEMKSIEASSVDTLIHYILHSYNNKKSNAQIIRYGNMLGFNLEINRVCIIIKVNEVFNKSFNEINKLSPEQANIVLIEHLNNLFKDDDQDLVGRINFEQYIIFKSLSANALDKRFYKSLETKIDQLNKYLKSKYNLTVSAFVGDVQFNVHELKQSYFNALKVLNVVNNSEKNAYLYDYNSLSTRLDVLLNDLPSNLFTDLDKYINTFIQHENYFMLSETFIAYCDNKFNLSNTSRSLFIHRNTLIYRLKKVKQLTKINIDKFDHCILLYIIIKKSEKIK